MLVRLSGVTMVINQKRLGEPVKASFLSFCFHSYFSMPSAVINVVLSYVHTTMQ